MFTQHLLSAYHLTGTIVSPWHELFYFVNLTILSKLVLNAISHLEIGELTC